MSDVLISSEKLLERLGREEQQFRRLGLNAHAEGVRNAIVIVIRHTQLAKEAPPPAASFVPSTARA